jgi:hypothetical protein
MDNRQQPASQPPDRQLAATAVAIRSLDQTFRELASVLAPLDRQQRRGYLEIMIGAIDATSTDLLVDLHSIVREHVAAWGASCAD